MLNKIKSMAAIAALVAASAYVQAESDAANTAISFKPTELAKGIYMLEGVGGFAGGNMLVSIGEQGVVMIDDSMPPFFNTLQQTLGKLTPKPVDFLINTHVHGDHTGNNATMAEGRHPAHIVAHQNMRKYMLEKGVPTMSGLVPAPAAALPVLTYSQKMAVHLNAQDMQLMHVPKAHTDGDTIIYLPQENIIHAGDVFFNGLFPYIDLSSGGSAKGYLAGQKVIYNLANESTKIVPGHGPLASRADLKKAIVMLEEAIKRVQGLIDKGLTEEAVVKKNPLIKYHDDWNWGFITTEKMTRTLYQSLKGEVAAVSSIHGH